MDESKPLAQSFRRLRILLALAGVILAVQASVLAALLAVAPVAKPSAFGPVTFHENVLLEVNIPVGGAVLVGLIAVSFLLASSGKIFRRYAQTLALGRHNARWVIFSLSSSITVFLVAQINGVTDIGTLVLMYAATSAMTLFSILQERMPVEPPPQTRSRLLPLAFGAALGIVPWGIIAFSEIAAPFWATNAGNGPSVSVRVITLVMLAVAAAFAVTNWAEQRRLAIGVVDPRGEGMFIVLSGAGASIFAWALVLTLT